MSGPEVEQSIRNFIFQYIDSVETIEILLFLRKISPESRTPDQIGQELRSNPSSALRKLMALKSLGLVSESKDALKSFKYNPKTLGIDALVGDFAETYRVKPFQVFELIFSPQRQIKEFADAFIIGKSVKRKEDDNGG